MILLMLACASTKAPSQASPDVSDSGLASQSTTDTGTVSLPETDDTLVQPSMNAQEVAQTLSTTLASIPDPMEIIEAYQFLMTQGDEVCPGNDMNIVDTWLYGCDASTGYSYAGVTDWFDEPYETGTLTGVAGDFWITTPEDQQLEGGGHSVVFQSSAILVGEIAGSWRWDDGSPWLTLGFSGSLVMEYVHPVHIKIDGAANIAGTHIAALDLSLSLACGWGPAGSLSLRDPEGGWYKMTFESCQPCATVVFEGEEIGESCVDFAAFQAKMESRL